jgi:hypothetical protein
MAQELPVIHFEDIPLAEARTMGRGPRMGERLLLGGHAAIG